MWNPAEEITNKFYKGSRSLNAYLKKICTSTLESTGAYPKGTSEGRDNRTSKMEKLKEVNK